MISWSSTECLGTLQSGTLSDRAQSGGHKNRIESCSWACRAIGLVFLSGATGQTARLANARLLPDRLSCQIAPDINRAIGARLARSLSSDQPLLVDFVVPPSCSFRLVFDLASCGPSLKSMCSAALPHQEDQEIYILSQEQIMETPAT